MAGKGLLHLLFIKRNGLSQDWSSVWVLALRTSWIHVSYQSAQLKTLLIGEQLIVCRYSCTLMCHASKKHRSSPPECWYQRKAKKKSSKCTVLAVVQTCVPKSDVRNFAYEPRPKNKPRISPECGHKYLDQAWNQCNWVHHSLGHFFFFFFSVMHPMDVF